MEPQLKPWVLVTGGSRGIGRGLVEALSSQYRVVFTYKGRADLAEDMSSKICAAGGDVHAFKCDGADTAQVKAFAEASCSLFGAPLAVINNAGITRDVLLYSMTDEDWNGVIHTNLDSAFLMSRAFLPAMMAERRGVILHMASVTAVKGNSGQVNYAATKAAMIGMAKSMSLELARFNIRVNAIAPGLIATEMAEQIPEKERKELQKGIPLRRMGTVQEIAELARYLISDPAAYITGQTIVIDGGLSA